MLNYKEIEKEFDKKKRQFPIEKIDGNPFSWKSGYNQAMEDSKIITKEISNQVIDEMIGEVEQLVEIAGTNRQLDVSLPVVKKIVQELREYKKKFINKLRKKEEDIKKIKVD